MLCLIDSVTRFAMALREIHLAAGEPPTSKGYPPTVFAELPRLLERAGPGTGEGSITGLFTVPVEGDDLSDPIADAMRAILDGHIVLDRRVAESGRFPALDVLRSLSRSVPAAYRSEVRPLVEHARRLIRAHAETAELMQLGAYRRGSDPLIDEAIAARPALEAVLAQDVDERSALADDFARLAATLGGAQPAAPGAGVKMDHLAVLVRLAGLEVERRAAIDLDGARLLAAYLAASGRRLRSAETELARLEEARARQVTRLIEHRLELKRLEVLRARDAQRRQAEASRREQRDADELAVIGAARRR